MIATKITGLGASFHGFAVGRWRSIVSIFEARWRRACAGWVRSTSTSIRSIGPPATSRCSVNGGSIRLRSGRRPYPEQLEALAELVAEERSAMWACPTSIPWGVMQFVRAADELGLPRVVSIQNAYNLLNRVFRADARRSASGSQISLLPYSVLGFGHLTGRSTLAILRQDARLTLFPVWRPLRTWQRARPAVEAYMLPSRGATG